MRIQKPCAPHDVESSPISVSTHHPRPRLVKRSPAVSPPPWEDVLLSSQQWRSTSSVSPYKSAESASTFGRIGMSPEAPSPPVQEPPLVNTQSSTSIIEISDNTRTDKKISPPQEIIEISDDSESDSDTHTRCKRLTASNVPVKLIYLSDTQCLRHRPLQTYQSSCRDASASSSCPSLCPRNCTRFGLSSNSDLLAMSVHAPNNILWRRAHL